VHSRRSALADFRKGIVAMRADRMCYEWDCFFQTRLNTPNNPAGR
jgi:hypothetical protein